MIVSIVWYKILNMMEMRKLKGQLELEMPKNKHKPRETRQAEVAYSGFNLFGQPLLNSKSVEYFGKCV